MKKKRSAELKTYRRWFGPNWRWKLAEEILRSARPHRCAGADALVDELVQFLRLVQDADPQRAAQQHPRIAEAVELWERLETQSLVTLLVLGEVASENIARRLATSSEVIQTVEQIFLDIRDQREATSWIRVHVIGPPSRAGRFAEIHFSAAFLGGPAVAEAIADGLNERALATLHDIANLEASLLIKATVALAAPTNEQDSLKVARLCFQLQFKMQKLELDRERFRHRCEIDRQKLALAQARDESTAQQRREQERHRDHEERARRQVENGQIEALQLALRRQVGLDRQEAALARAASSPLARLTWAGRQFDDERPIVAPRTVEHLAEEQRKVA